MLQLIRAFPIVLRFGNISTLFREAHSGIRMFRDSFDGHGAASECAYPHFWATIILVPGFLARFEYYYRLYYYFRAQGIRVVTPIGMSHNILTWKEARTKISDTIKWVEDTFGQIPVLVPHSKGCLDVLGILPDHGEISQVFMVAPPFRGSSRAFLECYFNYGHADPGIAIHEDVLCDGDVLDKITVITSVRDFVVPVREAWLWGARHIIIRDHSDNGNGGEEDNNHTGLPYHAREIILNAIAAV